jgi:glycosyltransferase involved in cell wall biosynthesis
VQAHDAIQSTLSASHAVVCDCDAVREELETYSQQDVQWLEFPWGIRRSRFATRPAKSSVRARFAIPEEAHLVITLRSWAPGYNVALAVRAAAEAMRQDNNMHLMLAGDGSQRAEVEAAIAGSGVDERIHLAGRLTQSQLPDYLFSSDTYLSCAEMDGSSITLLEAMAAGLPCVVTRAGGNPEWIRPGQNGWLCHTGHIEGFRDSLLASAALSQHERITMSEFSKKEISRRADWPRVASPLLSFLTTLQPQPEGAGTATHSPAHSTRS